MKLYIIIISFSSSELRNRVIVKVDILGSASLVVRTVSVDVKQHLN